MIHTYRADKFEIIAEGEGSDDVPRDESNLVVTGMKAAFAAAGKPMPTLKYHCINRIPYARCVRLVSVRIDVLAGCYVLLWLLHYESWIIYT